MTFAKSLTRVTCPDSSRCTRCPAYKGPAGSVTDDGSSKCRRCKSSKCGVCDKGYKRKCTGKIRGCPANIKKTKSAKKTSVKAILKSESPKCWENTQYWAGNGYTSLKVYQVDKKGRCLECQSEAWWRALADGGVNYCWYYQQSLGVLANAFQKKDGCPFPSSIKAKLKNQCLSDNRGQAFTIAQKFSAEYCGEKKTVYVTGEAKMIFSPGDGISAEVQYPYEDMKADGMVAWSYAS